MSFSAIVYDIKDIKISRIIVRINEEWLCAFEIHLMFVVLAELFELFVIVSQIISVFSPDIVQVFAYYSNISMSYLRMERVITKNLIFYA